MKMYHFYARGMHCKSCPVLIESELNELPEVQSVKADLSTQTVDVTADFGNLSEEAVSAKLSEKLKAHGYGITPEKAVDAVRWQDFRVALPAALAFVAVFVILQKIGVVNLIGDGQVTWGTALLIGFVASVSTCMAVVGGLVLSVSANYAKGGDKIKPQLMFHAGRLVAFFALGGVIGLLGSAFQLGQVGTFVLSFLVAVVLLILGLNLLNIFPWAKKLQPTLPRFLSERAMEAKKLNHWLTPALLGVVTFFLPCGFTQSMQIYTLSTGSFGAGAMTMLAFALGTLPVLALLSFTSAGIRDRAKISVFFKAAGLVVIFFAVYNMINSFVAIGLLSPVFNF
jgi:sulfite exporter TauE/SafE/copper chaperone CopZ